MDPKQIIQLVIDEGKKAFWEGKELDSNPYRMLDLKAAWNIGFTTEQTDAENLERYY